MIQTIITLALLLLFFLLNAFIAYKKGFNPLIWFLSGGLIGFIVILLLPSANKMREVDFDAYQQRKKTANIIGLILIALGIVSSILLVRNNLM